MQSVITIAQITRKPDLYHTRNSPPLPPVAYLRKTHQSCSAERVRKKKSHNHDSFHFYSVHFSLKKEQIKEEAVFIIPLEKLPQNSVILFFSNPPKICKYHTTLQTTMLTMTRALFFFCKYQTILHDLQVLIG